MHHFVQDLTLENGVPWGAVAYCRQNIDAVRSELLAAVERVQDDQAEEDDLDRGLLAMHLLAEAREQRLFPLLMALLPRADATELLGDAIGTTLPKLLISCFDGNADALFALLRDPEADDVIRDDAFGALAYLTWQGRIDATATGRFLAEFDTNPPVGDDDTSWYGWMLAIWLLGRAELELRVEQAFPRRPVLEASISLEQFHSGLRHSIAVDPSNGERFEFENLGPIEDLDEELEMFNYGEDDGPEDDEAYDLTRHNDNTPFGDDMSHKRFGSFLPDTSPARNPMRHVGRNDPCPCGSGKKYKRCCGATA